MRDKSRRAPTAPSLSVSLRSAAAASKAGGGGGRASRRSANPLLNRRCSLLFRPRQKEQAERSFDGLTWFVYRTLLDAKVAAAEAVSRQIRQAFADHPNWNKSENALRELRKKVTFAIYAETDDLDRVTAMVDELFTLLEKANRI
jgi:hypothetical protein